MSVFQDQIKGERAPDWIQEFATRVGGKTPFGDPLYRVVRAESVHHKAFGEWTDYDDDVPSEDRGKLDLGEDGQWRERESRRRRVVQELREIPEYPDQDGWLIERWHPAVMFEPRAWWECHPLLGPFPVYGRYVDVCKVMKGGGLPTIQQIEGVISAVEYKISNKKGTVQQRLMQRVEAIQKSIQARKLIARERRKDIIRQHVTSMVLSSSREAGAWRTRLAEKAGIRHHVGN